MHVGDDVHDLAVALDREALGHFDGAGGRDAAHVVAAQVEQHQVFGAFLGVGQKLGFKRLVGLGRGAARTGAGQGTDGDTTVLQPDQDFGAGPGQLEIDVVEEEEIGRRIAPTQRAIEGEGVLAPRRREAVAEDDLEDVARRDVVLGLGDHGVEALGVDRRMEVGRGQGLGLALDRQRAAQAVFEVVQARDGG
ncbi:hypothetical protein D3C72_1298630 [compost metagenome]